MVKYQIPYISMDHVKMGLVRSGLVPNYVEQDDKMQEVSKILSAYIEYHLGIEDIMSKDIYNLLKKDN